MIHKELEDCVKVIIELNNRYVHNRPPIGKNLKILQKAIRIFLSHKEKDRKVWHQELMNGLTEKGIRLPDILHFYIWEFLGFNIPRKNFCKNHIAPFKFISDMYFEKVRNSIAFANRTGGKTTNIAVLNQLDLAFKPGCEVASAGATKDQAARCYKYFTGFHNRNPAIGNLLDRDPTKSYTEYRNTSTCEIITGSVKGLNSPHPNKARIDEVELMDWEVLQEGLSMAMTTVSDVTGLEIMSQNCFSCIAGDTPIDVPRNMSKYPKGMPVKTLRKSFILSDKPMYVYCYSHKAKRFTLRKINNIWKTKRDTVYKLTYSYVESGKKKLGSIKLTKDHLILLKNGTYKEVQDLNNGDSLKFLKRKLKAEGRYHYVDLSEDGKKSKYVPEYVYIYGKVTGDWPKRKECIHHKDYNSFNNKPLNFQKMLKSDHTSLHMHREVNKEKCIERGKNLGAWVKDFWKNGDPEEQQKKRNRLSEVGKKQWKQNYKKRCKACRKTHTPEINKRRSNTMKGKLAGEKNPMYGISYEDHPKGFLGKTQTKEGKKIISLNSTKWNKIRREIKLKKLIENYDLHDLYINKGYSISNLAKLTGFTDLFIKKAFNKLGIKIRTRSEQCKVQWKQIDKTELKVKRRILAFYQHGNIEAAEKLEKETGIVINNHRVISIEKLGAEDVYDIEVEKHHNFVVSDGLVLHNSTRKVDSGTMQRLLDHAKNEKRKFGGFKVYEWCIWEVLERCNRKCKEDPKYGDCPILEICKKRAKKCHGYYKIDDFIDKCLLLDRNTLDAQWFNLKPSSQVLVYGDFWNKEKHIITRKDFEKRIEGKDIEYVAGIDFGTSAAHHFVFKIYACDVTNFKREVEEALDPEGLIRSKVIYYLVYEYRSGGKTLDAHTKKIKAAPGYKAEMPIFADPSAKQARIDMEDIYGIYTMEADNAVTPGIDKVRSHLQLIGGKAHYYIVEDYLDCIDDQLDGSHLEFEKYKYRRFRDGKVNREDPEPINDHGMDIDRYVISTSIPYFKEIFMPVWEDVEEGGFWFG